METRRLFDQGSAAYASARPRYPDALYRHLAGLCGQRRRAWDCATGTGQAALGLAQYFGEVLASDTSTQQIEHAVVHPGIRYSVQDAEATDYPDAAFDLVCVAQAWHWFDHSRFNRELLRVLRPGGVFAAWGYGWFSI
ncbi:class I SAM-dependent methyltransferase, partial [Pseudomonas aeruginosa]